MDLEVILDDISAKFPGLKYIFRSEYVPYLNAAGTILLGWLIVCWLFHIIWMLLAPLAVSLLTIILICPTSAKWCMKQLWPNLQTAFNNVMDKIKANASFNK